MQKSANRISAILKLSFCLAFASSMAGACLQRSIKEQAPSTTNLFVKPIENNNVAKIDLLFVVDNSASMGDKQKILESAVPKMLERLVRPDCVEMSGDGIVLRREPSVGSSLLGSFPVCGAGLVLEFNPVNDIHVGVISSSLGGHGSSACDESEQNDRALLMPKVREGVVDPHGTGFLVWHPPEPTDPPGTLVEGDLERLSAHFREHVLAVGENGCGFEAPLESWYRFLVDPSPPLSMVLEEGKSRSSGIDHEVLEQRARFLRPDSLVSIVLLTDENDCSVIQGGNTYHNASSAWLLAELRRDQGNGPETHRYLPRATSACEVNANDPCCFSCYLEEAPSNCSDPDAMAACTSPGKPLLSADQDRGNTRCFNNKARFGVDLLYPIERYVTGLSMQEVVDNQTGLTVFNPLLLGVNGDVARRSGLVFLAGITGVPWQDIADPLSLTDSTRLSYLKPEELSTPIEIGPAGQSVKSNRWELMLGQPHRDGTSHYCAENADPACGVAPVPPLDPFMIESIEGRSGSNPLTGDEVSYAPGWNEVNGHEQDNNIPFDTVYFGFDKLPARNDLQYSCIFPLEPYGGVTAECEEASLSCDCRMEPNKGRPLCQQSSTSPVGTTQYWGKAYPAPRILSVLKEFGDNAITASICPKVHDASSADFGYNPAVEAIIDRLSAALRGECLPRTLDVDANGLVRCRVVEAMLPQQGSLETCDSTGRSEVDPSMAAVVREELKETDFCDAEECQSARICEIRQFEDAEMRNLCQTTALGGEQHLQPGYCYIDAEKGLGDASLVAGCPAHQKQLLRFVGRETPAAGATTLIACQGDQIVQTDELPAPSLPSR